MEPVHWRVGFENRDRNDWGRFFENGLMVDMTRCRRFLGRWVGIDTRLAIIALFIVAIAHRFFLEEPENVIQDKVTVGLFGKEKGLDKFPPWL
jgi:hypothetical protein